MQESSSASLPEVAKGLSTKLFEEITESGQITDQQLSSLHCLYDKHLTKALQIIDQGGVFCFTGENSGRKVYQVQGQSSKDRYTVFPEHYCSCHGFFFDVISRQEALCCKHQLAARLAQALNKTRVSTVHDIVIAELLEQS